MKKNKLIIAASIIAAAAPLAQGAVTWAAGAPGGTPGTSVSFDGVNSTGATDAGTFLNTTVAASALGSYTISLWFQQDNFTDDQWFIGHEQQGIHLGVFDGNKLRHAHWGADTSGATVVNANTWIHATFTYDGVTDEAITYFNGAVDSTVTKNAPNDSSGSIIIGTRFSNTNGGTGRQPWVGDIDDVAIWDSVLTAAEVADLASGTQGAVALGAEAYYDFEDDVLGTTAAGQGALAGDLVGITANVPEPSSLVLAILGAAGFLRRKR